MTLPQVASFDSNASVYDAPSQAEHLASLLPSLNDFKEFVKNAAREQRKLESLNESRYIQSSKLNPDTCDTWGDPHNGRRFELTPSGCAFYQFKAGETLTSVVTDLLTECQKSDSSLPVTYETTRSAIRQILVFNNISDPDLIEPNSQLIIPSSLVPSAKRAA
ncbi:hypothetical protein BH10CYA1_BH10CYA1_32680 [soil metagenome]